MFRKITFSMLLLTMLIKHSYSQLAEDIDYCINENIQLINPVITTDFQWDFCPDDFQFVPNPEIVSSTGSSSFPAGMKIIEDDGVFYGFQSNFNGDIHRFFFGNDLSTVESFEIISIAGLNAPRDLALHKEGSTWYLFIVDFNSNSLLRYVFDSGLGSDFTLDHDYGDLGGLLNSPFSLEIVYDENADIIFSLGSFSNSLLVLANAGSTVSDDDTLVPATLTYTLSARITGIDIRFTKSGWKGLVGTLFGRVYHIDFGASLFNDMGDVTDWSTTYTDPYVDISDTQIVMEGGVFYGFLQQRDGNLFILELNEDIPNSEPNVSLYYDLAVQAHTFNLFKSNSTLYLYMFSPSTNSLYYDELEPGCDASIGESREMSPIISFSAEDDKVITIDTLRGDLIYQLPDTITILPQTAPSISFINDNVCINSLVTFDPTNTGITSYDWDFDGDGMVDVSDATGASQTFDYSGLGTGTYTVRLDVSDGTCDNFFEQEITIYDPPPAPSYTFSSPRTCVNTDYTFTNQTSDGGYLGPLEYLWEFIDEPSGTVVAAANTRDAVYAFETEGLKTVRLTSSIPGCAEVTEQSLTITPGPSASFFAASVCRNEAMQFTNTSTDAISYNWDFGDGFLSSAENPSHIFNGAGNFFVTLTATDAEGCNDTEVIEVAVSDSPQISFDFDIPCTSVDGIQFFDLTTVDNADLVSWRWFVDDVEVSTLQSPQIVFESTGVKNIRLDVQSSNGCESSYSEDIDVLTSPDADFNINLGCLGEPSTFTDVSTSSGNSIVSWLWSVEGVNYNTQDINHTFSTAGTFDVTLEVTGQNFCSETVTRSVEVIQLPSVDFSVNGECDNQIIRVFDQSTDFEDPIVARRWTLNGSSVGNGLQLFLSDLEDSTYELALELETEAGCIVSSSQSLVINDAPTSSFTSSRTFGIPNDQLTFSNTSVGGVSYQWLLDGTLRSTNPVSESITFSEAGTYNVQLVSQNSLGCYDTAVQEILIAIPEVDLAIGSFELVSENSVGRIFLEVQNFSNLPVESVEARIVLENTFAITEQIVDFIDIGESSLVSLNAGIPLEVSEPSYFCVTLISPYEEEYSDLSPVNNEKCITIEPIIQVEDPFPNPVTDQFRLKLVTSEAGAAKISLFNSSGKVELSSIRDVSLGLNNYFIDMSTLYPGIYYVVVDVLGTTHRKKVIKL